MAFRSYPDTGVAFHLLKMTPPWIPGRVTECGLPADDDAKEWGAVKEQGRTITRIEGNPLRVCINCKYALDYQHHGDQPAWAQGLDRPAWRALAGLVEAHRDEFEGRRLEYEWREKVRDTPHRS